MGRVHFIGGNSYSSDAGSAHSDIHAQQLVEMVSTPDQFEIVRTQMEEDGVWFIMSIGVDMTHHVERHSPVRAHFSELPSSCYKGGSGPTALV